MNNRFPRPAPSRKGRIREALGDCIGAAALVALAIALFRYGPLFFG